MAQPAGRLGDLTLHGGTIMAGFPMVLIGGQPAARLTDMHVCPMQTPAVVPIPHVGGPMITLGSPTVLIGNMPAVRAMDMAICVGPPDPIALGFPMVLIGQGAGGGAGGGGGGGVLAALGAAFSAAMSMSPGEGVGTGGQGAGSQATPTSEDAHWVKFQCVDTAGNPAGGMQCEFTTPDGQETAGTVGADGSIYWSGPDAGQAILKLMSVSNARWSVDTAEVGETVTMSADVEGYDPGTPATFQIYKRDIRGADKLVDAVEAETQADSVEADWEYVLDGEGDQESNSEQSRGGYSAPEYYFDVIVERSRARSDLLEYKDFIEIEVVDSDGNPMADKEYVLYLPNGTVRTGTLDGSGCLREENVPPGFCSIRFPDLPGFGDVG